MTMNRQLKNVGNRGDQHKHLALILQAPYLQDGRYRCSAGLARDVLGPKPA
jgi:hypothetical protein